MANMYKIDKEFKPSPKLKKLYHSYLFIIFIFFILVFQAPITLFAPLMASFMVTLFISTPLLIIFIFAAFWISKFYNTIFYKFTKNEIFWRRGIWFKTTGIVPYNRITNIDINQGPLSRSFGISSLRIQTAGYSVSSRASAELRLDGIRKPEELRDLIMNFVDKKKPMAVETYDEDDVDKKILNELVKIRKLLKKPKRKR
jgi:membrane protein YdbS with pleckstrin-like domain